MNDDQLYQTFRLVLEGIEKKVDSGFKNLSEKFDDKICDVKVDLARVEEQTKKTNGRVSRIEGWRDKITGALIVIGFILFNYITPIIVGWIKNLI